MADTPKCPKCSHPDDENVVPSRSQPGKWFCCNCGKFFENKWFKLPSLSETFVLDKTEYAWTAEEVNGSEDNAIAKFYALLNEGDRFMLLGQHILVDGDLREETED